MSSIAVVNLNQNNSLNRVSFYVKLKAVSIKKRVLFLLVDWSEPRASRILATLHNVLRSLGLEYRDFRDYCSRVISEFMNLEGMVVWRYNRSLSKHKKFVFFYVAEI